MSHAKADYEKGLQEQEQIFLDQREHLQRTVGTMREQLEERNGQDQDTD